MRLEGKKALVTGASRGIGRAIAIAYAAEGADVAITARKLESLKDTANAIAAEGRRSHSMAWDVTAINRADEWFTEIKDNLGGLDIVVNNAGVLRLPKDRPTQTPGDAWDYIMEVNLKALYFISQHAATLMQEQGSGIIINIASDAGMRGASGAYGISKWGVVGFTKGLAKQVVPHGVRVNAIAPGPVATEMMNWHPGKSMAAPDLPLGRYTLPEEIAGVALFLASDDSAAVLGQTIVVNTANT
jgi:NAD(P)-dependent dehydrogenase (short-subunit alcohol dehydrogenase family)